MWAALLGWKKVCFGWIHGRRLIISRARTNPLGAEELELQQRNRSLQGRGSTFLQKFLPVQPTMYQTRLAALSVATDRECGWGVRLSQNSCCCVLKVRSQTKRGRILNNFTSSL